MATDIDAGKNGLPYWPTFNSSEVGELMVFEEQAGLESRVVQNTMRKNVYDVWSEVLPEQGRSPPF